MRQGSKDWNQHVRHELGNRRLERLAADLERVDRAHVLAQHQLRTAL